MAEEEPDAEKAKAELPPLQTDKSLDASPLPAGSPAEPASPTSSASPASPSHKDSHKAKKGKELEWLPGSHELPGKTEGKRPVVLLTIQQGCSWDVDRQKALAEFLAASPEERSPDRRIGWLEQLPDGRWDYGVYDTRKKERAKVELEEKRPFPRKDFARALKDLDEAKQDIYFYVFSCNLDELYGDFAKKKFKLLAVMSVGPARLKFSIRGQSGSDMTKGKFESEAYYGHCWEKLFTDVSRKANVAAYEELCEAMEMTLQAGDKEVVFETSSYTVSKHMTQNFEHRWECARDDFLFPIYEKCLEIAEKLLSGGVHWQVKFSAEKARLAGTLQQTLTTEASHSMTKSFSGDFQVTLNSAFDTKNQLNESIQREDAEKGRPPPPDPEVMIAKFAEEGRKNWTAYMENIAAMKAKLKDRPLLMDGDDKVQQWNKAQKG